MRWDPGEHAQRNLIVQIYPHLNQRYHNIAIESKHIDERPGNWNASIDASRSGLKLANSVLILKANDEMIFSNYRLVSVSPVFSN